MQARTDVRACIENVRTCLHLHQEQGRARLRLESVQSAQSHANGRASFGKYHKTISCGYRKGLAAVLEFMFVLPGTEAIFEM
jgi:hypothetical protein